jgi:CRP-like cAMP-binding protein
MERATVSIEVLRRAEIFASLTEGDRVAIAVCFRGRRYAAGEVVVREGEPGATMLLVAEGTFVATARRADGREEELSEIGPGEVAGEMAFLDPAPRSATVRARAGGVAYELSHDAMEALRERCPQAVAAIVTGAVRDVTRRLRHLDDRIARELAQGTKVPTP